MVCIYCNGLTSVSNSRSSKNDVSIWRRRQCKDCSAVFTTNEVPDLDRAIVVEATDGSYEPFSFDKLYQSILESCKHRKSPLVDARSLTKTILRLSFSKPNNGSIPKSTVVSNCIKVLNNFDKVAATYYRAYYSDKNENN